MCSEVRYGGELPISVKKRQVAQCAQEMVGLERAGIQIMLYGALTLSSPPAGELMRLRSLK